MAASKMGQPWTAAERAKLERLARRKNTLTDEIAQQLGRTVAAVRAQATRHKISLRPANK